MKNTEDLRKQLDVLEKDIKTMLEDFIAKNGNCDIDINTEIAYIELPSGDKRVTNIDIEIYAKI